MKKRSSLAYAFRQTMPVLFGYLCLGISFGLLIENAGYSVIWSLVISMTCYAGSMQFVLVELLRANPPVTLVYTALMTLIVNGRHLFYGLSFIDRFKSMGIRGKYMIFSLTDETYSLLCSQTNIPCGLDEETVMFHIAWLDHAYWICGSILGGLVGALIPFDFTGLEFTMTALFTVLFIDQWRTQKTHIPAISGLLVATVCLIAVGPKNFMFPSIALTAIVLLLLRGKLDDGKEAGR